jgi:hypothetical protein
VRDLTDCGIHVVAAGEMVSDAGRVPVLMICLVRARQPAARLRHRHHELTRELIMRAVIEQLESGG